MPKGVEPKEVKAPPEMVAAADVALDSKMLPRDAAEMLKYLMLTRAIRRCGGNQNQAARNLGLSASAMSQAVAVLQARLT
jgi:hypothetical protein